MLILNFCLARKLQRVIFITILKLSGFSASAPFSLIWVHSFSLQTFSKLLFHLCRKTKAAHCPAISRPPNGTALFSTITATTAYQSKTNVSAPIPSFVAQVLVKPGTMVEAWQLLYLLQSKEQHALGNHDKYIEIKAVQSNETLTEHWIMQLADDSTVTKVPVSIGNSTADSRSATFL